MVFFCQPFLHTMPQPALLSPDALEVAAALIDLDAVRIMKDQAFFYTSGWASPVYVDTRLLMSDVARRRTIVELAARRLAPVVAERGVNAIVGAESSGIALAAWIAERLQLPLLYLRKRALGWGNDARLEGRLPASPQVVFIDDATTDARSKIAAVTALRAGGATVQDCMVVLDYGIYPQAPERLAAHDLALHGLTSWPALLSVLQQRPDLSEQTRDMLAAFSRDPAAWSLAHGGAGA